MNAQTKPPASFGRSLAGLISAPLVAFAAFIAGLAATSLVMAAWDSDVVYVFCFGLAYLGGLYVTYRLSRWLARQGGYVGEAAALWTLICYFATVVLLSIVLMGIIQELRAS